MCSSFNNFHGRLKSIFHVLSDDKMGSTPRFAPGSKATKDDQSADRMDIEVIEDTPGTPHTPGTPRSGSTKRKLNEMAEDTSTSASKARPRR
jgi:hypothetical protein